MIHVLLSIRKTYCRSIMWGSKTIELRKTAPHTLGRPVSYWLCETGTPGERKIVARFIGGVKLWLPNDLSDDYVKYFARAACVQEQQLREYLPCWGISVEDIVHLGTEVPISSIGFDRAPQSWRYIGEKQVAIIRGQQR